MKEKVFNSKSEIEVTGLRNALAEAGIDSFTVDKKDSSYAGAFGAIQIFVEKGNKEKAEEVIKKYFED
ncbi:putative signal transducing protein [Psychroflexus maritimus]|uniref:DUF2007 domain-containing protein n=1 Tax=Psychroflexus maritimus TaxID=2714865 RepID=A0A967ACH8_9FLAO|nr:DUF2007 domain-containing protein [Psychroflexus maritimus]NGZ89078.1 DUF2007 domain-containing protein [Psychroflexus maritimus]